MIFGCLAKDEIKHARKYKNLPQISIISVRFLMTTMIKCHKSYLFHESYLPSLICSLLCSLIWGQISNRPERPNVVIILADDLGWQDVGCYDIDEPTPMETHNIDALAKRGVLFRRNILSSHMAPTRIAIMASNILRLLRRPMWWEEIHTPYNKTVHSLMDPWYSGRMKLSEITIAEALKTNGYSTGHSGKWHMAIDHNAFPQPEDQGFDFTRHDLGESRAMKPHRLTGFATKSKNDPYRLDADGFPKDQMTLMQLTSCRRAKRTHSFILRRLVGSHPIHSPVKICWRNIVRNWELIFRVIQMVGN